MVCREDGPILLAGIVLSAIYNQHKLTSCVTSATPAVDIVCRQTLRVNRLLPTIQHSWPPPTPCNKWFEGASIAVAKA